MPRIRLERVSFVYSGGDPVLRDISIGALDDRGRRAHRVSR
jgi:hypothetical protein